jgi:hypothetical protein
MVEKCANPVCSTPFRRWGHGKLFVFENKLRIKLRIKPWPHGRTIGVTVGLPQEVVRPVAPYRFSGSARLAL